MQLEPDTAVPCSRVKAALAAAMAFLLLLASILSVSPAHDRLHQHGKGESSHQCALCLFAHGQVDSVDTTPVFTPAQAPVTVVIIESFKIFISVPEYQLLPGRAPPVGSGSLLS